MWSIHSLIGTLLRRARTIRNGGRQTLWISAAAAGGIAVVAATTSTAVLSIGGVVEQIQNVLGLEKDKSAPVDFGYGPVQGIGQGIGVAPPSLAFGQAPFIPHAALAAIPNGGGAGGFFSTPVAWPIIPIHMALLPDGRVMSYGTDQRGRQGGQIVFDLWNPVLGTGSNSHTVLPNRTATDIFCSASSVLGSGFASGSNGSGSLLITGGDQTIGGRRNFGQNKVNIFNPGTNTLNASGTMNYARWYLSITTLRNGDKLLLGGINAAAAPTVTPEIYHAALRVWTKLPGISINPGEWYYPRGFVGADGKVYVLQNNGQIMRLDTGGLGSLKDTGARLAPGQPYYPTAMIEPFKVLTIRSNKVVQLVDLSRISGNPPLVAPVVTTLPSLGKDRIWANATVLADGRVLVTGGSGVLNQFTDVDYQAQIFDVRSGPAGTWTAAPSARVPRLYHSAALLLPDGSVLTGGGGAPGPVNELNAEIYYPSYLYMKDTSGRPAARPTIVSPPPSALKLGQQFQLTVGGSDKIGAISLIRIGTVTHSFNSEQRRIPLSFVQSGATITTHLGTSPDQIPPGYYMLFAFNTADTPAVAKIVSVLQAVP